ncbi:hypothetical protein NDU88_005239 [Pleurodeles waltl]|uniref:Uncharacterized protein n=1 Tax=Pleurodeles waltl TaxID=8319 RepID=A0AAV7NLT4_PLEWA|nr:hypothetical protein NDU88_005239 [Pleurodeles waltl]
MGTPTDAWDSDFQVPGIERDDGHEGASLDITRDGGRPRAAERNGDRNRRRRGLPKRDYRNRQGACSVDRIPRDEQFPPRPRRDVASQGTVLVPRTP